jgi:hypothetical protein
MAEQNESDEVVPELTEEWQERISAAEQARRQFDERGWRAFQRLLVNNNTVEIIFLASLVLNLLGWSEVGFAKLLPLFAFKGHDTFISTFLWIGVAFSIVSGLVVWRYTATIMKRANALPSGLDQTTFWKGVAANEMIETEQEEAQKPAIDKAEEERFKEDSYNTQPWLLIELSGAHLLWWVSFIVLAGHYLYLWELSENHVLPMVIFAVNGLFFKGVLTLLLLGVSKDITGSRDHLFVKKYYRWLGRWYAIFAAALPVGAVLLAIRGW